MSSAFAGPSKELADRRSQQAVPSLALPDGPRFPRSVQAWLWLKQPTRFLGYCSRTYGDVFMMRLPLSTDLVHVTSPELVKAVFSGSSAVLRAGEANATILEPMVGPHSVLVLDGPEHSRQRKLIGPAFHGDRMRAWETTIRDITRAEIARWPLGKPFALRPRMQRITLEVIMRAVFGVDSNARHDELRRHIIKITSLGRNPFLLFITRDRPLGPYAPWARFVRARDALRVALGEQIKERRGAPDLAQRSDALSSLLLARDDEGRAMTDDEVRDELVTLLFAGHETTATSLAWAFDLLLHHPDALGRLSTELEGGNSEYLDAVIKETLRLRPVVALVDRLVRETTWIGQHAIQAGAIVCPNIYLAQRREDLYDDPAAFRPERFTGQAPSRLGGSPSVAASGGAWAPASPSLRCGSSSLRCCKPSRFAPPHAGPHGSAVRRSRSFPTTAHAPSWPPATSHRMPRATTGPDSRAPREYPRGQRHRGTEGGTAQPLGISGQNTWHEG